MASVEENTLLGGPRTPLRGLLNEAAARQLVAERFPRKAYCLVQDWTVFRLDVTEVELAKIHAGGQQPLILFAHNVVEDSEVRFLPGQWVRSTMCCSLEEGVLFQTRNTRYVLIGDGHEQTASLQEVFSFF